MHRGRLGLRGSSVKAQISKRYLANITLDHDLLFEFFLTFARIEFALKATGFVVANLREAKPDWARFGQSVDLAKARQDPKCAAAVEYLEAHPPRRQVVTASELDWDAAVGFGRLERMDHVLELVRRVRNNLFHGGKFNDAVHSGPGRNELLLTHSIAVLHRCLELSPSLAETYDTATL